MTQKIFLLYISFYSKENHLFNIDYKTKLEMLNKEGEQVIQFKLPCELEQLNDIQNSKKNNLINIKL